MKTALAALFAVAPAAASKITCVLRGVEKSVPAQPEARTANPVRQA